MVGWLGVEFYRQLKLNLEPINRFVTKVRYFLNISRIEVFSNSFGQEFILFDIFEGYILISLAFQCWWSFVS